MQSFFPVLFDNRIIDHSPYYIMFLGQCNYKF